MLHLLDTEGHRGCCTLSGSRKQLAVTHEALYRALADLERAQRIERTDGAIRLRKAAP